MERFTRKPNVSELTLREKIGQTVAFHEELMGQIEDHKTYFENNPYGTLWVTGRAYEKADVDILFEPKGGTEEAEARTANTRKLMNDCMRIPTLTVTDCEKGVTVFPGHPATTSAAGIGASDIEEVAYGFGKNIAADSKSIGLDWIWGPTLVDVGCGRGGPSRTFSDDPDTVIRLGKACVQGVKDAGVLTTIKHFPGSDTRDYRDSHYAPRRIFWDYDEWYEKQGRVFEAVIKDGNVDTVMIGHSQFPAVDDRLSDAGDYVPSTASDKVINGILREKFGFKGVVVTDAIGMAGLKSAFPIPKVYAELYKAGNDIMLAPMAPTNISFIDDVEKLVLDGELDEAIIDAACQRVLDMKEKAGYFKPDYAPKAYTEEEKEECKENLRKFNAESAPKTLTLVCDKEKVIPLSKEKTKKVKIIYYGAPQRRMNPYDKLDLMIEEFAKYGAVADKQELVYNDIEKISKEYDLIVYVSCGNVANYTYEQSRSLQSALSFGREKSVGVGFASPWSYFEAFPRMPLYVNAYSMTDENIKAFVDGLYGKIKFEGTNSFCLNPVTQNNIV